MQANSRDTLRVFITGFVEWCERDGVDLMRNVGEGDDYYRPGDNLDPLIDRYIEFLETLNAEILKRK